jgi:hypothetical protein
MAQISPERPYDHDLAKRVTEYLHTGRTSLFPFAARFDEAQHAAFNRDLREGLGELLDSGTARKTSATGRIMSDRRLREIVYEWRAAGGGWPAGADPDAIDTALAALDDADADDEADLASALIDDEVSHYRR